tara:strand:+ start:50 stop:403 length:354 start_codon:yes stop_codon:yes gene_type:complete
MKVLHVENDPSVAELVKIILGQEGIEDIHFFKGHEAIKEIGSNSKEYDALVFDYHLRDSNGIALARYALSKGYDRRIVILSADINGAYMLAKRKKMTGLTYVEEPDGFFELPKILLN